MADSRKNIRHTPSRLVSRADNLEGGEETEIAAQLSVPKEGGWGWVVVACSFLSMYVLDGIVFTFGSLLPSVAADLDVESSVATLMNSIAISLYFASGPFVSAFINRYGFRACAMYGSILSSFSLLISYFVDNFVVLCIFYGVLAGIGYCLINMSVSLVVGFYFEKLRSIAISISMCGSSAGVMTLSPLNSLLVKIAGWRIVNLVHAGLLGIVYFCSLSFRPLMSFTVVTTTTDDSTRTVTYLPSLATIKVTPSVAKSEKQLVPNKAERLFSAVSNANFPTAAAIAATTDETFTSTTQPGPSNAGVSKLTLIANTRQGSINQSQVKQLKSLISKSSICVQDKTRKGEITIEMKEPLTTRKKLKNCCLEFFRWENHILEMRPLYRDDAFYEGRIHKLPIYQKSIAGIPEEQQTGFEYQLAVSRAAATSDLKEKHGVFTTAVRRVLATMMNPSFLKKRSFLLLSFSGCFAYLGYLVPYIFIQEKNHTVGGIDLEHSRFFVSAISFSNLIGRIIIGLIACKVDSVNLYTICMVLTGLSIIVMNFSYNIYVQYLACCSFGFFGASISSLRSLVLVSLYGLDKLTNATGMLMLFYGIGSLAGPPMASAIQSRFGYNVSFYVAGLMLTVAGLILIPIKSLSVKEEKK